MTKRPLPAVDSMSERNPLSIEYLRACRTGCSPQDDYKSIASIRSSRDLTLLMADIHILMDDY